MLMLFTWEEAMFITWSALELHEPAQQCPWVPLGARFVQAGQGGAGRAEMPSFAGRWWSVLAVWDGDPSPLAGDWTLDDGVGQAWHVVLEPVSYRGDAHLSGGARPFDELPVRGKVAGAAAVITMAGFGPDPARVDEFLQRFAVLGDDVASTAGHRAALVQAPADGAVLTFSAWATLRDAVTWAYHRPEHAATVRRQEEHSLLAQTGFLRCAVIGSYGALHGHDPLAGLTGTPVPAKEHA
jgi:heme-degrading monooxygenase HmoA